MLDERELTVTEMLEACKVRMPTLSGHLTILREAGLVRQRVSGSHRIYRLQAGKFKQIRQWLSQFNH